MRERVAPDQRREKEPLLHPTPRTLFGLKTDIYFYKYKMGSRPPQGVQMLMRPAAYRLRRTILSWSQACWVLPLLGGSFLPVNQYGPFVETSVVKP